MYLLILLRVNMSPGVIIQAEDAAFSEEGSISEIEELFEEGIIALEDDGTITEVRDSLGIINFMDPRLLEVFEDPGFDIIIHKTDHIKSFLGFGEQILWDDRLVFIGTYLVIIHVN